MAEDIVQWPYDADPMADNEVSEETRIMAANENDDDKMASVTVKQLADKAAERVEYMGIERPEPFDGGATEGAALSVPDGPSGANQVADVVSGKWYDFGAGPVQTTSTNRWRAYWDGSSWSLVDMGELPVGSLKEWIPGSYLQGDVRTYKNKIYRAKVNTTATPTGFDWQEIGGHADAVNDQTASINFNGATHELEVSSTLVIVSGNNRYRVNDPVNLALVQDEPAVLYVIPDSSTTGNIGTIATQDIGSIPGDAIVFASYNRTAPNYYSANGIVNYSVNGRSWIKEGDIKEWVPGAYLQGDVRIYKDKLYRAKVNTTATPTGFDWQEIGGRADVIHDQSASVNFNGGSHELEISSTLVIVSGNNRYRVNDPVNLALVQDEPAVLYIVPDSNSTGDVGTIATQNIGNLPAGAIMFASYTRTAPGYYVANGLNNYSVNGLNRGRDKAFMGVRSGFPTGINFDTVENKVKTSSTNVIVFGSNRIFVSPQSQEVDMATSGIHVVYFTQDGTLGSIVQSSISSIPLDSVIIGTYQRTSANVVLVNGIDNYAINGVDARHLNSGFGRLVSNGKDINVDGQNLEILGTTSLFVGRNRYGITPPQSISFSSSPSVFFYTPSTGEIGTTTTASMSMPADAIIFGGHTGVRRGRAWEMWGLDNYMVKGLKAGDWQYKIIQKKFLTDFDPTPHYYISDTTLSMTDDDPETLIGSDPTIITDRYEALMTEFPDLITKEVIATIPTANGDKDIAVYTFTPPSVSTAPRPDSGKVVNELPYVFINCGLHGIEKTAPIAQYQFFEDILYKWQDNKILEWFRWNVKMSIIPVANPAGWINGTRPNGNLVDLNRNFPAMYIPNQNPGDTTWSGLEALDQPESLAINNWMEEHKTELLMGIDFHNFFQNDGDDPNIMWTEGVSQFSNQLGRIAAQRVSRGSRNSSPHFPSDYNEMLGVSSYVSTYRGRLGAQMNSILPHGFTFEVSQNFRYNPNFKPNDNDAIRIGTEAWGNSLMLFVWHCMQDYNAKEVTYETL